jgi:hypothetical protein
VGFLRWPESRVERFQLVLAMHENGGLRVAEVANLFIDLLDPAEPESFLQLAPEWVLREVRRWACPAW